MAPTSRLSSVTLTVDEVDDLIYASRTGDLSSLVEELNTLASKHTTSVSGIIATAVDIDPDGLGSQNCLLHYPAANGNLEITEYLLSQLSQDFATSDAPATNGHTSSSHSPTQAHPLINHQNVSGNTPLHWSSLNGHLAIVQALVNAGADPTIVNEAGRDAVVEAEYSAKESAQACADWMLKNCQGLEHGAGGGEAEEADAPEASGNAVHADGDEDEVNEIDTKDDNVDKS